MAISRQQLRISAALACSVSCGGAFGAEPVVITATRTAKSVDDTIAPVTVLTTEQLRRSGAQNAAQALRGQSGVDITRFGGEGALQSFYMRGTNPDHVLVLVDGVRVGSATDSAARLELIPTSMIERIEVVRGPRASLYGDDALGGVIQVFTRKDVNRSLTVGLGTHETAAFTVNGGHAFGGTAINGAFSHRQSDGFNARKPSTDIFSVDEPDEDGMREDALTVGLNHQWSTTTHAGISLLRAQAESDFDGFVNHADTVEQVLSVFFDSAVTEKWTTLIRVSQNRDDSDNFSAGAFYSRFNTRRDALSWQNDFALSQSALLTLGADAANDRVESTVDFSDHDRRNTALFAQWQWSRNALGVEVATRRDHNDQFGDHATGNIALRYNVTGDLTTTLSAGTAFKAPSFNDLYWPNDTFFVGNAKLEPEESESLEVGLRKRMNHGYGAIHLYQTDIDKLIVYEFTTIGTMNNVERARIQGVETEIVFDLAAWRASAAVSVLDPRNRETQNVLARRARKTARFELSYGPDTSQYGLVTVAQGSRFDDAANTRRLAGYGTVDLFTHQRISDKLIVSAFLKNILDKDYQTVLNYYSPPLSALVQAEYTFQ